MPPAARVGDMHTCPLVNPGPVPHVGGPILPPGCPTVLIGMMPAARITDMAVCVGPPDAIAKGSPTVIIGNLLAARLGDLTVHGGVITVGFPMVMIGEAGGPGGGGGAGGGMGTGGGAGTGAGGTAGPGAALGPGAPPVPGAIHVGYVGDLPVWKLPNGDLKVGPAIVIKPSATDPQFQNKVLADLTKINQTPTGGKLMESIGSSGKTMTIQSVANPGPGGDGNVTGYTNGADRFKKADGTAGNGTNSIIGYNADNNTIGTQPWETRPPGIGLAHEMVHGDQAMHGTMSTGNTNNDAKPDPADPTKTAQEKTREVEAVGPPADPGGGRDFTENKIRDEWDPKQPQRQWY